VSIIEKMDAIARENLRNVHGCILEKHTLKL